MAITTVKDYFNRGEFKRVEISDQVDVNGSKGHVVNLGRKYVEILFYPGQAKRGRVKADPFSPWVRFLGTQHN